MTKKHRAAAAALPLAAYTRVSSAAQAESGIGLDAQRNAIETYARQHEVTVGSWHEDAGRSGKTMARRPGLAAALAEVHAGRAGGIVVGKIDRLGRSSGDVLGLVERAQREGWRIVALDVGLDSTSPAGEMVCAALAMAARFEYRRGAERQLEKHEALRRAGRPRGRPAVAADIADRIIALRALGMTYQAIADQLNAERVPTARGAAAWSGPAVRSANITRGRELAARKRGG